MLEDTLNTSKEELNMLTDILCNNHKRQITKDYNKIKEELLNIINKEDKHREIDFTKFKTEISSIVHSIIQDKCLMNKPCKHPDYSTNYGRIKYSRTTDTDDYCWLQLFQEFEKNKINNEYPIIRFRNDNNYPHTTDIDFIMITSYGRVLYISAKHENDSWLYRSENNTIVLFQCKMNYPSRLPNVVIDTLKLITNINVKGVLIKLDILQDKIDNLINKHFYCSIHKSALEERLKEYKTIDKT